MDVKCLAAGLLLLLSSCGPGKNEPLKAEEEYKEVDVKSLYVLHCEACHGMDGTKGTSGAADLSVSKLSDHEIKNTILNGNDKGMMPYKDIITSDKSVNSMVEYVKTLRK